MSAAIHTRYGSGARGSYIRAWTKDGKGAMALRVPYAHELHHSKRHPAAAKALAEKLGWSGLWIAGHNDDTRTNIPNMSCVRVPGSYSRNWIDRFIPGVEGEDWFFVEEKAKITALVSDGSVSVHCRNCRTVSVFAPNDPEEKPHCRDCKGEPA